MKVIKNIVLALIVGTLLIACNGKTTNKMNDNNNPSDSASTIRAEGGDMFMLVGTYTSPEGSKGIYVYKFNTDSGKADSVSMVEINNPSYLALSPDEQFVYAVGENDNQNSVASAFSFDKKTGRLTLLNSKPTVGGGPCYIVIDNSGKNVFTANYGGGSISSFEVKDDGSLENINLHIVFDGAGPDSTRQTKPHLHSVMYSPDGRYLFAADLGTDNLYRFDAVGSVFEGQPSISQGSLKKIAAPAGTGPRHFDFHPSGKYMYLLGELSGQVVVYDYSEGTLTQTQAVAADTVGARGSADIHASPDGRFLYASNRLQADGLAIFSINGEDGSLTKVGYQLTGRHPRNFAITPNGKFLLVASRDDNKIQVFSINTQTGLLTDTNQDIALSKPVCIKFAAM